MGARTVIIRQTNSAHNIIIYSILFITLIVTHSITPYAGASTRSTDNYMEMTLEELMQVKITSVSKSEEELSDAAAAVYVITQEDIRRSGATCIPEALRMAPGIEVARMDANKWAITSRGFNGRYANKLLVMIDGRSVYTPLYSGVYWDMQDTMMEDIERIEVIRGPGATMWGENAVNGVINIITKKAEDTQGVLVSGGAGNQERGFGNIRYGGTANDFSYRLYGKSFYRESQPYGSVAAFDSEHRLKATKDASDQWSITQGGFRTDWKINSSNNLTLQGDIYGGYSYSTLNIMLQGSGSTPTDKANINGGNLLARWKYLFDNNMEFTLQTYYDRSEREQFEYHSTYNIWDIDIQQTFPLPWRQNMITGFNYRIIRDDINSTENSFIGFDSSSSTQHFINGFIQDEIELIPQNLTLIIGSKFGHNDYTGFEIQPNVRIMWKPAPNQTVWCAVSRAVRTPSKAETMLNGNIFNIPATIPPVSADDLGVKGDLVKNPDFKSETLTAYEAGWRIIPIEQISLDIAVFYNRYDHLRTLEPQSQWFDFNTYQFNIDYKFENMQYGSTYGLEVSATFKITKWWKLYSTYSWLNFDLDYESDSDSLTASPSLLSPRQQFSLRSNMDIPWNMEWDAFLKYTDSIPGYDIPSYTRFDMRFGWSPAKWIDISLMLENLFDDQHPEFGGNGELLITTDVPRSFYGKITLHF